MLQTRFFSLLFKGAEAAALEKGFNIILCNTDDQPEKERLYVQGLRERKVDGLILATAHIDSALDEMTMESYPYVLVNRLSRKIRSHYVVVDNLKGARIATEHLIELGHRHIEHISGPLYTDVGLARLEGYRLALKEHGLPFTLDYVVEADFNEEAGYHAAVELLKRKPRVTAIFAANDLIAMGVITAGRELGIEIPDDISLVGFNNLPVTAKIRPSLTTVNVPLFEMGFQAAKMLIKLITGEPVQEEGIVLEPDLVVRESTRELR